jgi:hypothetical protein
MNENNKYLDLIYLVLDGEASEIERSTLFGAMADNQVLQNEFNTALKLNKAANSVPGTITVPMDLTNNLFNKAGLNFVNSNIDKPIYAGITSKFNYFTSANLGFAIAGIVIGIALMFGVNEFVNNNDKNSGITNLNNINSRNIDLVEKQNSDILENSNINVPKSRKIKIPVISQYALNNKPTDEISETNLKKIENTDDNNSQQIVNKNIEQSNVYRHKEQLNFAQSTRNFNKQNSENYNPFVFTPENNPIPLSFEIRNSSFWNTEQENVFPSEIAKFHNSDIFIYYKLIPDLKIGAGVRQETFYAKYIVKGELSREFIYEQQPNLTNFEIALRYSLFNFDFIKPIFQLNFGGGTYGYTYRGTIGSEFWIYDNVGFVISGEFANFIFTHQNVTNNSSKFGINYGFNFKF